MDNENDVLLISEEEEGERLDKVLAKRYREIQSRTYFQNLIEQNRVLLNGEPVKKRIKPKEGDEVQIQFLLTPEIDLEPENIPLDIIYEDDDLLVINKPAGMVVHPAPGNWTGTFVNALLYHCQHVKEGQENTLRPGIVHRLDKDTSGLLVAAKNALAHQRLVELFAGRKIQKEYLAICLGNPGTREIDAPIGRHPINRKKMAVVEGGKKALSICETIKADAHLSLVKIFLMTGRTHQIRVHLKHAGASILGDETYGNPQANAKYGITRQLLHAYRLAFEHPMTGKKLDFTVLPPPDMQKIMDKHGFQIG